MDVGNSIAGGNQLSEEVTLKLASFTGPQMKAMLSVLMGYFQVVLAGREPGQSCLARRLRVRTINGPGLGEQGIWRQFRSLPCSFRRQRVWSRCQFVAGSLHDFSIMSLRCLRRYGVK